MWKVEIRNCVPLSSVDELWERGPLARFYGKSGIFYFVDEHNLLRKRCGHPARAPKFGTFQIASKVRRVESRFCDSVFISWNRIFGAMEEYCAVKKKLEQFLLRFLQRLNKVPSTPK